MQKEYLKEQIMKPDREWNNMDYKKTETAAVVPPAKAATQPPPQPSRPGPNVPNGGKTVIIEAKIDVGFGNMLYLRGEGQGLSWDQGIPLKCVNPSTWKWSGKAGNKLKFKLLLNDAIWSKGEDLVATPGDKIEVSPAF